MTRIVDRLKLHRRRLPLDGREYAVVTLRPGTDARFSTNFFHETWHVVSDWRGARLLGRLLWGLDYQRVPGTLVLIERPFLDPNPAARQLRRQLPLDGNADGTVRWHTHGLHAAVAEWRAERNRKPGQWRPPWIREASAADDADR